MNPCAKPGLVVRLADLFIVECHCCTFYRGVGLGLVVGLVVGWVLHG